jgi:hypothetical protein
MAKSWSDKVERATEENLHQILLLKLVQLLREKDLSESFYVFQGHSVRDTSVLIEWHAICTRSFVTSM